MNKTYLLAMLILSIVWIPFADRMIGCQHKFRLALVSENFAETLMCRGEKI